MDPVFFVQKKTGSEGIAHTPLKDSRPEGSPGEKKNVFFFTYQNFASFCWKFLKIFAKIRSSRDISKNGVLGQNFDF